MKYLLCLWVILCVFSVAFSRPENNRRVQHLSKGVKPMITQGGEDPDPTIRERRNVIEKMMRDAFDDYKRYAWGDNELKPISQTGSTGGSWGNSKIGATIVDSLDTLYIMGLMDRFQEARDFVANTLDAGWNVNATVSIFETNIRFVGGLLSAYALSGDFVFINRAYELAKKLLPAFDTPTGIPFGDINLLTGEPVESGLSCLAAYGTFHLEFVYLSQVTGDPIFEEKVQIVRDFMDKIEKPNGLTANFVSPYSGEFASDFPVSIGGFGDSYYEYLLKGAIQRSQDEQGRRMYDDAMNSFVNNGLVKKSAQNKLTYFADMQYGNIKDESSHLACFAGGMFALGAHVDPNNPNAERDAEIALEFTNTCHESYIRTATKLGPGQFQFNDNLEAEAGEGGRDYSLRPEVIESYFYLWRITKDKKYRDWGWDAAQAINKHCKAGGAGSDRGYSGLRNVLSENNPEQNDQQETYFLAETLKYLYLLFSTDELIDLDEWVFNTEAHPLPVQGTNPMF